MYFEDRILEYICCNLSLCPRGSFETQPVHLSYQLGTNKVGEVLENGLHSKNKLTWNRKEAVTN